MDSTSQFANSRQKEPQQTAAQVVNLRPHWRLRVGLAGLGLLGAILYVTMMLFSGRGPAAAPDPEVVQAEWDRVIGRALDAKRPADEPMALPASRSARIGLMRARTDLASQEIAYDLTSTPANR